MKSASLRSQDTLVPKLRDFGQCGLGFDCQEGGRSYLSRHGWFSLTSHGQQMLRVPRYRIEDDSYIEQFEKTSSVSRAIAQSSLSQLAAELAMYALSPSLRSSRRY